MAHYRQKHIQNYPQKLAIIRNYCWL